MKAKRGSRRSYPPFVKFLAALGRISTRRPIRQATPEARLVGAAVLYLKELAQGRTRGKSKARAVYELLARAKGFDRAQFFSPERAASQLGLPPGLSSSRVFAAWLEAGAPGDPIGWPTASGEDDPEKAYRDFVLDHSWEGTLEIGNGGSSDRKAAPYSGEDGPFREFLKILGSPEFGVFRTVFPDQRLSDLISHRTRVEEIERRLASGPLAEMVRKAAELEPLIMHPDRNAGELVFPQFKAPDGPVAMHAAQKQLEYRTARAIVVIPHCRMSGAARVAAILAHSLARLHGEDEVVVIRTDLSQMDYPEWFPSGCRQLDFAASAGNLQPQMRQVYLLNLIRSLNPQHVFNVNSRLMWDMSPDFAKILSDQSNFYAYLFCSDINAANAEAGYPVEFFSSCFDKMTGIITDSAYLETRLRERFLVPEGNGRLAVIRTPLTDLPDRVVWRDRDVARRPKVFWAGRFDRQKRIDLVYDLAGRMPDVDFLIWGKAVLDNPAAGLTATPNMRFQGTYDQFADLPLSECDAWLYTSAWDGVPTILMDAAAAGIPLVGSHVGGTGEVMTEDLSAMLPPAAGAEAYEEALRSVLHGLPDARKRASALADKIRQERTMENYDAALRAFLKRTEKGHG